MKGGRRKGFTLMELLIVAAIITALAALLFPVFQYVRKAAYMTTCRSNLKQIYHALKLYEEDYGEFFYKIPPGRDTLHMLSRSKPYAVECDLARVLYPYAKNTDIFVCPACPNPDGFCRYYFSPDLPRMSYYYNYAFARWKGHPITPNLVSHYCGLHAEWRIETIEGETWIFLSPYLVCLMDGSIHLYYPPVPVYLERPFTYP